MDSFFDVLESVAPLVFMVQVLVNTSRIRSLNRRIERLETKKEEKIVTDEEFWKRYETTRPKVK